MSSSTPLQKAGEASQDPYSEQEKPFNFLGLPNELRLMIYSLCLVPSPKKPLQSKLDVSSPTTISTPTNLLSTSLLRLSRSVHAQALPILYAKNTFHYSISTNGFLYPEPIFWSAPNFSKYLPLMRNITLDFSERNQYIRESYAAAAEITVASHLREIKKRAISLNGLSLHFVAIPINPLVFEDLPGDGEIATLLREIKPRLDSLFIIGFGNSQDRVVIEALCAAVAERSQWKKECSRDWGEILLREENVYSLARHMSIHNPRAEDAVHCWRWSRKAVLKEEKAREVDERSREDGD